MYSKQVLQRVQNARAVMQTVETGHVLWDSKLYILKKSFLETKAKFKLAKDFSVAGTFIIGWEVDPGQLQNVLTQRGL
jgi:hypothetical protein